MKTHSHLLYCLLAFVSSGSLALAQNAEEHSEDAFDAEHACIHMEEGPNVVVQAGAEPTSSQRSEGEHIRLDVSLLQQGESYGGFFGYTAEEAGDVAFLSDSELTLVMVDEVGEEAAPERTFATIAECGAGVKAFVFDLEAGDHTYFVSEAQSEMVRLVVEVYEGEHHDEHEGESGG